jgi:hypothetical protein
MISMSGKLQHLKPGDLITADFMNTIIDAINSLDARLAVVEKRLAKQARLGLEPRRPTKQQPKA